MNALVEPQPQHNLPTEVYRVYEATDPFHARPYRLALCLAREKRLLEDISSGRRLLRLGRLVMETCEAAQACAGAETLYL
ncbi:MAG: hypothetical protein KKF77_16830 [Proteobacteria bacterium]|nr:hypothetical protein [Pseudomonadota bacterium]